MSGRIVARPVLGWLFPEGGRFELCPKERPRQCVRPWIFLAGPKDLKPRWFSQVEG